MNKQNSDNGENTRTIGRLLLESGKLKAVDAERIVKTQKEKGLRFGDAAVSLGLITEDDIEQVVSKQFHYHCLSMGSDSVDDSIVTAFKLHGKEVEAFRGLRSQLSLRWFMENKFLVVTASREQHGTSFVAANLAVTFSQLGQRTLLIDANMRKPTQFRSFKLHNKFGLSDILVKRAGIEVIEKIDGLEGLHVLSSGTIPPNPLELLGNEKFTALKDELSREFEIVIIDSPPIMDYSDAQALASSVKGVLVVARKNVTKLEELEDVKELLVTAGAEPLGVVINEIN